MYKTCSKCNVDKLMSLFHKDSSRADGLSYVCKECTSNRMRKYTQESKAVRQAYKKNNRGKINADHAKRRAGKLKATLDWADTDYIKDLYCNAKEAEKLFKTKFHIDHIIPLRHGKVCGLHNQFNLQVLTAEENLRKSNFFK